MSNQANRAALFGGKASGAAANKPVSVTAAKPSSSTTTKTNGLLIEPIQPVSKTAGITPSNQPKTQSSGITLSAEARRKKQEEIQQLLERANTALKTTMFQWSPDYLVAAPLFEQAAEIYKQLGDLPKAIEYFQKAAEAHEKCKAISSAALALTKAANIAVDNNIDTDAPRLLQGVAEYWAAYGDLTRYGETVHKLGKQVYVYREQFIFILYPFLFHFFHILIILFTFSFLVVGSTIAQESERIPLAGHSCLGTG